jgi:hypothetical protein
VVNLQYLESAHPQLPNLLLQIPRLQNMRPGTFIIGALGIAAAQQTFQDVVPKCSVDCLTKGIKDATTCSLTDSQCQCQVDNSRAIYTAALDCVMQACGSDIAAGMWSNF